MHSNYVLYIQKYKVQVLGNLLLDSGDEDEEDWGVEEVDEAGLRFARIW